MLVMVNSSSSDVSIAGVLILNMKIGDACTLLNFKNILKLLSISEKKIT